MRDLDMTYTSVCEPVTPRHWSGLWAEYPNM